MARPAHVLIDVALQRVRDPLAIAHSRSFVLDRLSQCQQIVNAALGLVLATDTFSTTPQQVIYQLSGAFPNAIRVVGVKEGSRDLARLTNFAQLNHLDMDWMRATGPRYEAWCSVGRDLLVLYPAREVAATLSVTYVKLTTQLINEADSTELPDEYLDEVTSLLEAVLLAKQRDLDAADAALMRVMLKLGMDMNAVRLHLAGSEHNQPMVGTERR